MLEYLCSMLLHSVGLLKAFRIGLMELVQVGVTQKHFPPFPGIQRSPSPRRQFVTLWQSPSRGPSLSPMDS